jgi:putative iron-only hydrogenase system regulator
MEKKLGIIGIVVEDLTKADEVNAVIHEYNDLIVARMGIPYKDRGVSVISLLIDGDTDAMNALTGQIGRIENVTAKSMIQKG